VHISQRVEIWVLLHKTSCWFHPTSSIDSYLCIKHSSLTAKDTSITRPNKITWESTSGTKNSGCVEFTPHISSDNNTEMKLSFTFVAPRVVSSLFRRSNKLRSYKEDVLLMGMLTDFRNVVMEEDVC
jgi:uncharacterized membrane protein